LLTVTGSLAALLATASKTNVRVARRIETECERLTSAADTLTRRRD
jgi:hypothetical protein